MAAVPAFGTQRPPHPSPLAKPPSPLAKHPTHNYARLAAGGSKTPQCRCVARVPPAHARARACPRMHASSPILPTTLMCLKCGSRVWRDVASIGLDCRMSHPRAGACLKLTCPDSHSWARAAARWQLATRPGGTTARARRPESGSACDQVLAAAHKRLSANRGSGATRRGGGLNTENGKGCCSRTGHGDEVSTDRQSRASTGTHLSGSGSRPAALLDCLLRSLTARGPHCQLPWHPWIVRLAWRRWPHVAVDGCPARGTDV